MVHLKAVPLTITFVCLLHILSVDSIIIDTKLGQIEGTQDAFGSYVFQNIRYAEPPIGKLRWRATQPLKETWKGIYNATAPGNACIQPLQMAAMMTNGSNGILSEDCLTLSIQTPYDFNSPDTQSLRPVLFWIHGGGLYAGTGYSYAAHSNLPKNEDIVLVPINYRLGVAAWLVNPELRDSPYGNGGANGFLDMIEALKWVKDNIESYGGNPNEITVAGESGGGWATCGLLLSPLAKGIFKRSIQMSGSCIQSFGKFFSVSEGMEMAKIVRDSNNVKRFNELRELDMQNISEAQAATMKTLLPTVDGYVFPLSPFDLLNNGYVNGESTMIGTVFRESFTESPFYMGTSPQNFTQLNDDYYKRLFDTEAILMQQYYPQNEIKTKIWQYGVSQFDNNTASLIQTVQSTDCWVKCGSLRQVDILASHPVTKDSFGVYFYQYGYIDKPWDQVSHGYDIIGLFGTDVEWVNCGVAFSPQFVKMTQNFFGDYVKGVTPMEDGKSASVQNGYYVQIVDKVRIVGMDDLDVVRERCKVWDIFGHKIWRDPFCMAIYADEVDWEQYAEQMNPTSSNTNDTSDKQEI